MAKRTLTPSGALAVEGLKESIAGLRGIHPELPRVVTKTLRESATNPVAAQARANWAGQRIRSSQAASAIKPSATTKGAAIVLKYGTHPYAAGVEFGSHQYRQFQAWRGNQFTVTPGSSTGYVVQAAIRDTLPEVERRIIREVVAAIHEAVR